MNGFTYSGILPLGKISLTDEEYEYENALVLFSLYTVKLDTLIIPQEGFKQAHS